MKHALWSVRAESRRGLLSAALAGLVLAGATMSGSEGPERAPEFPSQDPQEWIGPPQTMKGLAGKVVILDVWTFG